jgi:alkylation response protein AidB-like acyl-CoA dehydrogenase
MFVLPTRTASATSMTTLMNERTTIGGATGSGGGRRATAIQEAVDLWKKRDEHDAVHRDRLAQLWIENEVLRYTNLRAAEAARKGNPGPEGSIAKLALANLNKATYDFCIDLLGPAGLVDYDFTFKRPAEAGLDAPLGSSRKMFLRARANSIEGGTSEIMRNILGERMLGLPGEPRTDRELPWSQVPRS